MSGRRCDFCRAPNAPFGYAPPPALLRVPRSIWTCAAATCRDQAEARRQALLDRHDPLKRLRARERAPDPAQGALF